jgi:glycosyltransferase involved in cell wall biosynthesis
VTQTARKPPPEDRELEVSVVLPCLNEERTLAGCIATIKRALQVQEMMGEIIVADNGSADGSQGIAIQSGARLVHVQERGYGSALRGGIAAARGKYVIFADADGSYDFMNIPRFVDKLREGNDLVMGNRFAGKIHDGAMPWLHRYVGNPVLSWIGRLLFRVPIGDFHCGLRGVSKAAFEQMQLRATGMEFATEMVIKAGMGGLRITEIPVELRPDGRDRPPHLRTWRDGWRHLQFMLLTFVRRLSWGGWAGVVTAMFVAVLLFAQVWRSGWCNDESAHIPAGLYHLETGRMDAYRVNPPLPRMLAALPLLFDRPKLEWYSLTAPQARNEYSFANDWIQGNLEDVPRQLRLVRSMMMLFFALGAWTIYRWTFELYGRGAAWLALALWSLSPDVITYSATVAPDLPAAATVLIINLVYGFEGTGRRLADFEFLSAAMGGEHESRFETGNLYRGTLLGMLPMPIPREMLQGLDYLKWEFERGFPCYLLGEWKSRGWWYFYLVAMAVKLPVGYFVLMAIGSGAMIASFLRRTSIGGEWLVPLVGVLFIAQVSSQTGFTHHLRYVLPAFGFLYILAARSVTILPRPVVAVTVCLCLAGTVIFHAMHLGQAHTHFNWLAGGPKNGWRYLSLSNLDWGQSTYRMTDWARAHPEKRPLTVVFVSPLGNPSRLLSDLDIATHVRWLNRNADGHGTVPMAGWYLMSSRQLTYEENLYFRNAKPQSWPYADVALFYVPNGDPHAPASGP